MFAHKASSENHPFRSSGQRCDNVIAPKTNSSSRSAPSDNKRHVHRRNTRLHVRPTETSKKAVRTESSTIAAAVVEATISRNGTPAQDALPQTRPLRIHSSHLHWPYYERCVSYAHVHDSRDSSLLHTHRILTHPFNYVVV